jgi:hypothetical protein
LRTHGPIAAWVVAFALCVPHAMPPLHDGRTQSRHSWPAGVTP